jgi:hypothetical protein
MAVRRSPKPQAEVRFLAPGPNDGVVGVVVCTLCCDRRSMSSILIDTPNWNGPIMVLERFAKPSDEVIRLLGSSPSHSANFLRKIDIGSCSPRPAVTRLP